MNLMCKIFGHKNKLLFDMPTACVRCGQERPAVKLKHIPPMPKVKQLKNGDRCGKIRFD